MVADKIMFEALRYSVRAQSKTHDLSRASRAYGPVLENVMCCRAWCGWHAQTKSRSLWTSEGPFSPDGGLMSLPLFCAGDGYSVAFDPLVGSNVVDSNFAVGTVFGVWPGDQLLGVRGYDQVAAGLGIYGPRTVFCLAIA
eukprot:scaffold144228_cov36-Prasinocladus_malaysianus.AAC.1